MKCLWINKIQEEITELSKIDWSASIIEKTKEDLKEHDFNEEDEFYNKIFPDFFKIRLREFSDSILLECFESLNYSIIAGECFFNEFIKEVDNIINLSGSIQYVQFDKSINEDLVLSLEDIIKEKNPLSILKDCLIEYKSNAKHLLRYVENPSLNTLFDLSDQTNDILEYLVNNDGSDIQKHLLKLVKNNFFLLRKDFVLKYEIKELQDLLLSKNQLLDCDKFFQNTPNSTISKIIPVLIDKSIFLIRKFIIRKRKEENIHNENYVFLGEETDFDLNSHKLSLGIFEYWDEYSINHFLSEENSEKAISLKRNAKRILNIGKISALDFHALTKYFKDLENDIDSLESLENDINEIQLNLNIKLDKYSIDIIENYISNNVFSEKLKSKLSTTSLDINDVMELIEKDLKRIQILQNRSCINNFFPYYKICDFLCQYIDKKILNSSLKDDRSKNYIQEASIALSFLKDYFESFKLNLKWSKNHLNYAYQLPYSESIRQYTIDEGKMIDVFSSSSFSLPIDFEKYDDFIAFINAFILRIENEIKSLLNITSLMEIYGGEKENLHNEIKDNFKKNIELLGIFSAIIALVFGGISTITKDVKFEDQFLILVTLFIILFTFITLLKTYVNNDKEKDVFKILGLFFVYLIFLVSIIVILSFVLKLR
ncbi:hypothetical protein CJ739_1368 [Mariniflexile rhizosphaerae]|uniref:hypothetical protein n=1 Tax=unclassified Mariniflexile TaxID=2643887 RepID=UPI000CB26D23|nr:hypothetical protein [Mariniflexile sp. TRM1-10]AXP80457.1 hypothetical protein CJ739_1368 [Mariniflexile sp. TRM1-10]PLB20517.1 MAG: hypothetical protein TRG1_499 [Flavobacteriaceae bacterium FS1-H7996/R]